MVSHEKHANEKPAEPKAAEPKDAAPVVPDFSQEPGRFPPSITENGFADATLKRGPRRPDNPPLRYPVFLTGADSGTTVHHYANVPDSWPPSEVHLHQEAPPPEIGQEHHGGTTHEVQSPKPHRRL